MSCPNHLQSVQITKGQRSDDNLLQENDATDLQQVDPFETFVVAPGMLALTHNSVTRK